jgi:hypothetical protein
LGQLLAEAFVLGQVLHGVVFAAVQRHSAAGALVQNCPVDGLDLACGVLALPDFSLCFLREFHEFGLACLRSEH